MRLRDPYGRVVDYLRISVTDRCNLRCRYCSPSAVRPGRLPPGGILSVEEIVRAAEAAVAAGIRKIRITGGEPLTRRGVVTALRGIAGISGLADLAITTNGVLLAEKTGALKRAGLGRVNVSLDTLRPDRFRRITGADGLRDVLAGIERAHAAGLCPVKINTVVMRGINDDEIPVLADMTRRRPFDVRFIELMPFYDPARGGFESRFMSVGEMAGRIAGIDKAADEPSDPRPGPARLFRLPDARGRIGFIAPMSRHFCGSCNRLRLTADGKIRSCLFGTGETDIAAPLRAGASKRALADLFRTAAATKPFGHDRRAAARTPKPVLPAMHAIGG